MSGTCPPKEALPGDPAIRISCMSRLCLSKRSKSYVLPYWQAKDLQQEESNDEKHVPALGTSEPEPSRWELKGSVMVPEAGLNL